MSLLMSLLFAVGFARAELPLVIDDPALLQKLEAQGFDFARLALRSAVPLPSAKELATHPGYASIVESLTEDLEGLRRADRKLGPGMKRVHRLMDVRWLRSEYASYELVGIVSRPDRASFQVGSCGEFRFIYRLAYRTSGPDPVYSRLPMTFNAVLWAPPAEGKSCKAAAALWKKFVAKPEGAASFLALHLKSIEVNLQSVRWPSTIRPDMGGYAEYFLRVFKQVGSRFEPGTLENTPDVLRLKQDASLRARLLAWLKANLREVDAGVARLPEEFLARKATSVALLGPHRVANAPYSQVFQEEELAGIDYAGLKRVKSAHGLLRRLNDLSCVGCHQGRTVAGFHFLGRDRAETAAVNAIFVSASPHFLLDQKRREKAFFAQSAGTEVAKDRPFSVRADAGEGEVGSHCGLGDPSFVGWGCAEGFRCVEWLEEKVLSRTGVCVPVQMRSGSFCRPARMVGNIDPHRDAAVEKGAPLDCGDGKYCQATGVGFPGGMCSGSCASVGKGETCGSIAILDAFNSCLARRQKTFVECLSQNVRPASFGACDEKSFCRDDYICARTGEGKGACIPPYFLFQLRVDGHPEKI
jgi:hypothetical protein